MRAWNPRTLGLALCLLVLGSSAAAWALEAPPVAQNIPKDAVFAVFVTKPDQAANGLGKILERFKSISAELDLAKLGEKVKSEVGENLFTREGLEAFGLDVDGTAALYSTDPKNEDRIVMAIPLKNPSLFKSKVYQLIAQKSGQPFEPKPKNENGIEIVSIDDGFMGFRDNWVALQVGAPEKGKKELPIITFFAKGNKLGASPVFIRALAGVPSDSQVWIFADMKQITAKMEAGITAMQADMTKLKLSKEQKDSMRKDIERMRKEQSDVMKALDFMDGLSFGLSLQPAAANASFFMAAKPTKMNVLKLLFPPEVGAPGFHDRLMNGALLGGWFSLNLDGLFKQYGSLPAENGLSVKQTLEQANTKLKQETNVDLFLDLLGNLKGPWAIHFLNPGSVKVKADESMEQQLLQLLRVAMTVRVKDGANMIAAFNKMTEKMGGPNNPALKSNLVEGATIWTFEPQPGLELGLGVKQDALFLTLGKEMAPFFAKTLSGEFWAAAQPGVQGSAQLSFPNIVEAVSSAVNAGMGDTQFKTAVWPIAQMVLSKFGRFSVSSVLLPEGLQFKAKLDFM